MNENVKAGDPPVIVDSWSVVRPEDGDYCDLLLF